MRGKLELQEGLVIVSHSSEVVVEDLSGRLYTCRLRRKNERPVCGDRVEFNPLEHCIEKVLPRRSALSRPDSYRRIKPLAANIDRFFIVCAVEPGIDFGLIDRYLVAAHACSCDAVIVLNKSDLINDTHHLEVQRLRHYRELNYPLIELSTVTADGMNDLENSFSQHTCILVGQSGVGKSSIILQLIPDIEIRIGSLSEATGSGCHTTTTTTLYHLPAGGDLIDSPGVRSFRLWNLEHEQVVAGFKEFQNYVDNCRFHNCRHIDEPGCAVKQAVADGLISADRYESFLIIADSLQE